ncbi:hypothetical protein DFH07DRAFT_532918 [Mycena maculata]|uniref:Pentatricopeptide repeat-containing protein n=1 Tax=Mycena maculata TaxID=230809 RepID=A0AAD7IXD5_9AGAR|nr:hypothetical protein DFH07DRAFT_532918 [Mycena maculata]
MSLRTGLVRAARLSHIPRPRFPPPTFVRALHDAFTSARLDHLLHPLKYPDEPNAVRRHYLPLIAELERIKALPSYPPVPPLLTREQIITILDLLATSGRPPDLDCIRSMFFHLPIHFGVAVTPELHSVVLSALLKQGYVPIAQAWIQKMPDLPPHISPTREHFHLFLKGCPPHSNILFLREVVVSKMRRAGIRPDSETFSILIRCYLRNATEKRTLLRLEAFTDLLTDMKIQRLVPDPSVISLISEYYIENGFPIYAEDFQKIYDATFPDALTPEEEQRNAWNKQLTLAAQSGVQTSLDVFRTLAPLGCTASPDTVRAILGSTKSVEDLRIVEEALGVRGEVSEYALLVNNNIRIRQVQEALTVYEEAKKAGITPVAGLVAPIIRSLVSGEMKNPGRHNSDVDTALSLYSDLDEAFPPPDPDSPEALAAANPSEHSKGPDVDIYSSLLRGLSLSSNIKTAHPIALSLLNDMKSRGIKATTSIKTSNIVLEMRNCDTLDDAFQYYRKRRADLTEQGYISVLHAFSRMSLRMGHPDSLEMYFEMVAEMRQAGFKVSARIYTDILQQFAEIANIRKSQWRRGKEYSRNPLTPMPPKMLADLNAAVHQIHDIMTLDPRVTPQSVVWNQLLDTYQRLENFPAAYRTWQWLFYSGKYGPVAVSIILDACGYAGDLTKAKEIVAQLTSVNYVLNLHNWNTYVECLCRLQQFSDAIKVVTLDMGSITQPVKPDASTITMMLRSADSRVQTNIILQKVRRLLPELWESLPQTTKGTAQ